MDISFQTKKTGYLENVCSTEISREDSFESTLSELMPEISEVLTAGGTALLRSKNPEMGAVSVGGTLELSMTYKSQEDDTLSQELSVPLNYRIEEQRIDPSCLVVGTLRVLSVEVRVIGARKVIYKVLSSCKIRCYREEELILPSEPEQEGFEVSQVRLEAPLIRLVEERTFDLSDHFSLEGPAASEILSWSMRLQDCSPMWNGGRLTVNGKLCLSVIYRPRESDQPVYVGREETFTQTVDGVGEVISEGSDISVALTSAYVTCEPGISNDGKSIGYDVSAVLQYSASELTEILYVKDLYRIGAEVETRKDSALLPFIGMGESISEVAEAPVAVDGVSRWLNCSGEVSPLSPSRERDGRYRGTAYVQLLYQDDKGFIRGKNVMTPVESEPFAVSPQSVSGLAGECAVKPVSNGCELRIPVDFHGMHTEPERLDYVISATEEPKTEVADRPALWLRRFREEDDLWEIGKEYGVRVNDIREASDLSPMGDPAPGTLLLIPNF